ncbi:MAG: bifunctional oligoribonuclease/PAP phosphatase NrnA [Candidatus Omnitrophica bacterium]|nr:bifunctional oligoribonuclease/PAP phosphatase NrnA [Candidatus Omnitrophota bacterium]
MQSKAKIIETIRRHKRFLISSHINPEGDSLGSALALRGLLVKLGKKVEVVWDGPVPPAYRFLPGTSVIKRKPSFSYDTAFIVDCPTLSRIGRTQQFIDKRKPLCAIDHHISNERFGTVNWVDPEAAAVGEMVYFLFKMFKVKPDRNDATNLYASIVGDTGSFRYSNTTPKIHRVAAELIALGVSPAVISNALYESTSLHSRRLLALALGTLKVDRGGKMAWIKVTQKMFSKCQATSQDSEGFVDYPRSLKGVQAAVLLREEEGGGVKVSFRSKSGFDVNRIARRFGGGGHRAASGCFIRETLPKAEAMVLQEIRKALRENAERSVRYTPHR